MDMLVLGRGGQVARELLRRAPADTRVTCVGRAQIDLAEPGSVASLIADSRADVLVNAAAWTAVDDAEEEEAAAHRLNADMPGEAAAACDARGIPMLHLSTDYVFDGSGEAPWRPDDPVAPASAYGRSKLAGERSVFDATSDAVILRTAWVFSSHGTNFVKTMLRLAASRDELSVVDDQHGGPTAAAAIATALHRIAALRLAGEGAAGVFHFSGAPDVSWADFAREIFARSGAGVNVANVTTSEFPRPAPRPANSRLDCTSTREVFGIERPSWREDLQEVLDELEREREA